MEKKSLLIWSGLIALSFVLGFLLANVVNRGELETLRAENERLKSVEAEARQKNSEQSLSSAEIDQRLADAERNPTDFQFQRNLGLALYRYGAMKQEAEIIEKVLPVLERVHSLERSDRDVIVALGNAHFDLGYFGKRNDSFERAREYYRLALDQQPADADVRADLALTYFLQEPADTAKAIIEFREALKVNPDHEKTLQFLIQALTRQGNREEAAQMLERLKKAHPSSPSINELSNLLAGGATVTNK